MKAQSLVSELYREAFSHTYISFISFTSNVLCVINLYPCNYLSRECGMYNASDLLLGDHVCEKSDIVKWIDCLWLLFF